MRLIDADELIKEANADGAYGYVSAEEIANAPTVEAEPVIHSRWEITEVDHGHGDKCYHCPECGWDEWRYKSTKRCPNCGAKMEKEA